MKNMIKALKESNVVLLENANDLSRFLPHVNDLYDLTVGRIKQNELIIEEMKKEISEA